MTFSVVSTFSGCGGSSLGYKLAGGKVLLAVEWEDNSVATYKTNFPDTPIYHGDIKQLSVERCLELANLEPGQLDIFDGSPPCQGFSTSGSRNFDDQRNRLFREYVRLLRGLQPKCCVMENVSGMVKGKMKLIFAECMRELKAAGYRVKAKLMNAQYYNVPQSRNRLIFIGVRNDLGIEPSFPAPTTLRPITVKQAFQGLDLTNSPTLEEAWLRPDSNNAKWIRHCRAGEQGSQYHPRGSYFNARRIHPNRPSPTILHNGGRGEAAVCHYEDTRYLTTEELRRLHTYPDDFVFIGNLADAYNRIGNSVPPNLMRAIAEHLRASVLGKS